MVLLSSQSFIVMFCNVFVWSWQKIASAAGICQRYKAKLGGGIKEDSRFYLCLVVWMEELSDARVSR